MLTVYRTYPKRSALFVGRRFNSSLETPENPVRVAIVGAGPSAFYTASHLLNKRPHAKIDFFERLPFPFGLSRYGVAPDHQEVKNCEDKFREVASRPNVDFYGNVEVGKDIKLPDLQKNYHAIIFAYGASEDKKLGIQGGDLPGVISARSFVGWYNGVPEFQDLNPRLDKAENVVIIGNGNVALDVARILLSPVDHWKGTDISSKALTMLENSTVKRVNIVARKGCLQSAFTNVELRELLSLYKVGIMFHPIVDASLAKLRRYVSQLQRVIKRRVEVIDKFSQAEYIPKTIRKSWSLDYFKAPMEVIPHPHDKDLLSATRFVKTLLVQESFNAPASVVPTKETELMKSDLLITSIGYKGIPLPGFEEAGIPFDKERGIIPNFNGKVIDPQTKKPMLGLYASGWIRRGPQGVLATTMIDSNTTAEIILSDIKNKKIAVDETKDGFKGLVINPKKRDSIVTWDMWLEINKQELRKGVSLGKIREKLTDINEAVKIGKTQRK